MLSCRIQVRLRPAFDSVIILQIIPFEGVVTRETNSFCWNIYIVNECLCQYHSTQNSQLPLVFRHDRYRLRTIMWQTHVRSQSHSMEPLKQQHATAMKPEMYLPLKTRFVFNDSLQVPKREKKKRKSH